MAQAHRACSRSPNEGAALRWQIVHRGVSAQRRFRAGGLSSFRTYPARLSAGYRGFRSGENESSLGKRPRFPDGAGFSPNASDKRAPGSPQPGAVLLQICCARSHVLVRRQCARCSVRRQTECTAFLPPAMSARSWATRNTSRSPHTTASRSSSPASSLSIFSKTSICASVSSSKAAGRNGGGKKWGGGENVAGADQCLEHRLNPIAEREIGVADAARCRPVAGGSLNA